MNDDAAIERVVPARPRDVGGLSVRRALPSVGRRHVGPFVFFDHMGPVAMPPGEGLDIGPHPHIALATLTFLFEGELEHKDGLGSRQIIRPGDVNWMVAGRGLAHSERSPAEARREGARLHGIQSWVALPLEHEEAEPRFEHHPARDVPRIERHGAVLDVIAGTAYGMRSPVGVLSPTTYVHARLDDGARLRVEPDHVERALYVVDGAVAREGASHPAGTLLVLAPGAEVAFVAQGPSRAIVLGGAPLDGERHIWWNFVSSSRERIERAKDDWTSGRFARIPGDDGAPIPLPAR